MATDALLDLPLGLHKFLVGSSDVRTGYLACCPQVVSVDCLTYVLHLTHVTQSEHVNLTAPYR